MTEDPPSGGRWVPVIVDLCRFRSGPQELPCSTRLLGFLLLASVVFDVGYGNLLDIKESVLGQSLLTLIVLLGLSWIALSIRRVRHRYVQTAIALVACSIAFSLLILPLAWLFGGPQPVDTPPSSGQMLIAWLGLGVMVWKIAVDAHIVRQAIESSFAIGFLLALSWAVAHFALSRLLFGDLS